MGSAPAPLDAAPKPTDADDDDELVDAVCESRSHERSCACPTYTELAGSSTLTVNAIHRGAFSSARAEEAVVEIVGCESGAATSQTMTSRALVRHTTNGWKRVSYAMGALGDCTPIVSRGGAERLVCRSTSGHGGLYREAISLASWRETAGVTTESTEEIVGYWTGLEGGPTPVLTMRRLEVEGLRLVVDVDSRSTRIHLEFVFDGARFRIAPASANQLALLDRLGAEPR